LFYTRGETQRKTHFAFGFDEIVWILTVQHSETMKGTLSKLCLIIIIII